VVCEPINVTHLDTKLPVSMKPKCTQSLQNNFNIILPSVAWSITSYFFTVQMFNKNFCAPYFLWMHCVTNFLYPCPLGSNNINRQRLKTMQLFFYVVSSVCPKIRAANESLYPLNIKGNIPYPKTHIVFLLFRFHDIICQSLAQF